MLLWWKISSTVLAGGMLGSSWCRGYLCPLGMLAWNHPCSVLRCHCIVASIFCGSIFNHFRGCASSELELNQGVNLWPSSFSVLHGGARPPGKRGTNHSSQSIVGLLFEIASLPVVLRYSGSALAGFCRPLLHGRSECRRLSTDRCSHRGL